MKSTFMVLLTMALTASSLFAVEYDPFDLTTRRGETYHRCRITKITPAAITLVHDRGVTSVPLHLLDDEWRTKFGYDPAKAEQYAAGEGERRAAAVALEKEAAAKDALARRQAEEGRPALAGNNPALVLSSPVRDPSLPSAKRNRPRPYVFSSNYYGSRWGCYGWSCLPCVPYYLLPDYSRRASRAAPPKPGYTSIPVTNLPVSSMTTRSGL